MMWRAGFRSSAALLLLASCAKDAAQENAIPLKDAAVQPGEFFPRELYARSAGCSDLGNLVLPGRIKALDDFEQKWFSAQLAAAGERPLIEYAEASGAAPQFLVRFTWLPSFDNSVVVRVAVADDGKKTIVAKRLSGAGGYEPGNIAAKVDRNLTDDEWRRIDGLLKKTDLLGQQPGECALGADGAEWIVEAIDRDGYHFLKRWSPERGPVRETGQMLLNMTGWQFKDVY